MNDAKVTTIGEGMVQFAVCEDGRYVRGFGGDTLNAAVYLARLGLAVRYVTALGTDPASDELIAAWAEEDVDTQDVLRTSRASPGLYVIETDAAGERRFLYWREHSAARLLPHLPDFDRIAGVLTRMDAIVLSGITLALYDEAGGRILLDALDAARCCGARIVFDANVRPCLWPSMATARAHYAALLPRVDLLLASVEDIALLTGDPSAADLATARAFCAASGVAETVLKRRDLAAEVAWAGTSVTVAGCPAPHVVDTTAAGDSFAAGYLAARLAGATPGDAAACGHALAAVVVQHRGAIISREVMPTATWESIRIRGVSGTGGGRGGNLAG